MNALQMQTKKKGRAIREQVYNIDLHKLSKYNRFSQCKQWTKEYSV